MRDGVCAAEAALEDNVFQEVIIKVPRYGHRDIIAKDSTVPRTLPNKDRWWSALPCDCRLLKLFVSSFCCLSSLALTRYSLPPLPPSASLPAILCPHSLFSLFPSPSFTNSLSLSNSDPIVYSVNRHLHKFLIYSYQFSFALGPSCSFSLSTNFYLLSKHIQLPQTLTNPSSSRIFQICSLPLPFPSILYHPFGLPLLANVLLSPRHPSQNVHYTKHKNP